MEFGAVRDVGRDDDAARDVVVPTPAFVVGDDLARDAEEAARAANATSKDLLVFHVEGGRCGRGGAAYCGVPSYPLRHAVSRRFAPPHVRLRHNATPDETRAAYAAWEHTHGIRRVVPGYEYARLLRRARFCLISEGFAPHSPRLAEAFRVGCVPCLLSPSLRPPFSTTLDWSQFSLTLDPRRLDGLFETLRSADHALLHANLLRVRPLFAWCLATKGACDERRRRQLTFDALDLTVFEMSQRVAARRDEAPPRVAASTGMVLGLASLDGGQRTTPTKIRYACSEDTASCSYNVGATPWNCSILHKNACVCRRS